MRAKVVNPIVHGRSAFDLLEEPHHDDHLLKKILVRVKCHSHTYEYVFC